MCPNIHSSFLGFFFLLSGARVLCVSKKICIYPEIWWISRRFFWLLRGGWFASKLETVSATSSLRRVLIEWVLKIQKQTPFHWLWIIQIWHLSQMVSKFGHSIWPTIVENTAGRQIWATAAADTGQLCYANTFTVWLLTSNSEAMSSVRREARFFSLLPS